MPEDSKFHQITITERNDFAHDLWMIRARLEAPFAFQPGQYATLGVPGPERPIERPYSIVSSPHEGGIEFFFELVPNGDLTPLLYRLQTGDQLLMRKAAKGRFMLDTTSGHKHHLLVCTVTGIAPFVSYARSLQREWDEGRFAGDHHLYILNGASRSWEFGYRDELQRIADAVPWLTYVPTVSRPWEDTGWRGEVGRVDELVRKYADQWKLSPDSSTAYLCGHPDMIGNVKGILQRCRYRKEAIKEELYWVPKPAQRAAA